jgi:hypothetical protein
MYVQETSIVHIGFGMMGDFRHPLGVLERIPLGTAVPQWMA